MTNEEAIRIIQTYVDVKSESEAEALDLAIKALETLNDVSHKIYRNENCSRKHHCYDYQGYHCAGCNADIRGAKR